MKKFFNDHIVICIVVAVAVAGTALYYALDNRKKLKGLANGLADAIAAGQETPTAAEQ